MMTCRPNIGARPCEYSACLQVTCKAQNADSKALNGTASNALSAASAPV